MELNEVKKPVARLYSTREIADFIGIPYMKLYRMVKDGRIKAINVAPAGSKKSIYNFRAEDVQVYFDSLPDTASILPEKEERDTQH
jgi:excisionase family DNA binding protein